MAIKIYRFGDKEFHLDLDKATKVLEGKKVINGVVNSYFDILPLKYVWAYEMYRKMKANHWEPEDIPMHRDIMQWNSKEITDEERWVIKMGVGYFSAAEGIVGDNIIEVVRELVTASELKLVLGRHAHEENIHADSLVYIISSLQIDPFECEAIFTDIPSVRRKTEFVHNITRGMRKDMDTTITENKQKLAHNIFTFGLVMEGTQFYSLFAMILALYRANKFPGIGQMFRYTLRDESNHIELFRLLFLELIKENPDIMTDDFRKLIYNTMAEGVAMEIDFIRDTLPSGGILGLKAEEFEEYIRYISNRRLASIGFEPLYPGAKNTLPWLSEVIDVMKEQNFFEGRVTEYKKASSLIGLNDL